MVSIGGTKELVDEQTRALRARIGRPLPDTNLILATRQVNIAALIGTSVAPGELILAAGGGREGSADRPPAAGGSHHTEGRSMSQRQTRGILGLTLAVMLGVAATADAHHGWSGYDSAQMLHFTGVIREAGYEHPHGHVRLEVPGKVWLVVLAPPSRMERRGLPSGALAPGAQATVVGYPSRTNPEEMRAERISLQGKTVELR